VKINIRTRLAKLEAAVPDPPNQWEGMTADELREWILNEGERLMACTDISEEHRAWLRQMLAAHSSGDLGAVTRVAIPRDLLDPG
jgi:hypothetical protein